MACQTSNCLPCPVGYFLMKYISTRAKAMETREVMMGNSIMVTIRHPERSEGFFYSFCEILRYVQNDNLDLNKVYNLFFRFLDFFFHLGAGFFIFG